MKKMALYLMLLGIGVAMAVYGVLELFGPDATNGQPDDQVVSVPVEGSKIKSLSVTFPPEREIGIIKPGDEVHISWTITEPPDVMRLSLYHEDGRMVSADINSFGSSYLVDVPQNSPGGNYLWKVPEDMSPGYYMLKLRRLRAPDEIMSPVFRVIQ